MLEELLEEVDRVSPADPEDPRDIESPVLAVESAQQRGEDQVELRLCLYSCGQWQSEWLLHATGVAAMSMQLGAHGGVDLLGEHPLLIERLDRRARLLFRGAVDDVHAVAWELLAAYRSVMGTWGSDQDYWNQDPAGLLRGPAGILAEGPVTLMSAYARVLRQHGMFTQFVSGGSARRMLDPLVRSEAAEGSRRLHAHPSLRSKREERDLHVLLLSPPFRELLVFEEHRGSPPRSSYLIAERFSCVRFVPDAPGSWNGLA